jgi:hypothetical protein
LIDEQRRRAYLGAMQVTCWLPRLALPFAAPSRAELLEVTPPAEPSRPQAAPGGRPNPIARPQTEVPAAKSPAAPRKAPVVPLRPTADKAAPTESVPPPAPRREPPPRFALQLLRAGNCLLLAELPTGEPFASRDPAYRLLKDLLRAAGLPDSPRPLGEPIRWPLIRNNPEFDQGPAAARDYVRAVLQGQLEQEPAACTWLIGVAAMRFAGEEEAPEACREIDLAGLGMAWTLPGLEQLMEAPPLKAELWQSMRRIRRRWTNQA